MKYIFDFYKFNEEINPRDISFIESKFDNYFTIAFEFEVETEDTSNYPLDSLICNNSCFSLSYF